MYGREAFIQHPYKRSKSETAYSMVKVATQGAPELPSDTKRLNEALCKVLAHDVRVLVQAIHELGIEPGLACTWRAYKEQKSHKRTSDRLAHRRSPKGRGEKNRR